MDENGWVRPEYANSTFLIFVRQGNELFYATTLVENDCAPGDDIFTNDLQIALEKRQLSTSHSPLWRKGGIFHDLYRRIQREYRIHISRFL